jgi:hypothetical protein
MASGYEQANAWHFIFLKCGRWEHAYRHELRRIRTGKTPCQTARRLGWGECSQVILKLFLYLCNTGHTIAPRILTPYTTGIWRLLISVT